MKVNKYLDVAKIPQVKPTSTTLKIFLTYTETICYLYFFTQNSKIISIFA